MFIVLCLLVPLFFGLLLALAVGALIGGCGAPPAGPPAGSNAMRFLALGDSYTIGERVDVSQRWPVQLAGAVRKDGINLGDPEIIAQTGWTTGDLLAAMDQAKPAGPYDLVTLLIGVNNEFQGREEDEYRQQFGQLLDRAIALAGGRANHVVVLSIPDWGVTLFAKYNGAVKSQVAVAIDRFNAINKELTQKAGAAYVDITPLSRAHGDLIADDGLHPNGEQYALWVKLAQPAVENALRPTTAPANQ
jgi:lysophospholipase L1-like esterase